MCCGGAETVSTLKFAHRAKAVRNSAAVNEGGDQRTLLRKYEAELRRLRAELQQRQREVVDKRHLLAARALPPNHNCIGSPPGPAPLSALHAHGRQTQLSNHAACAYPVVACKQGGNLTALMSPCVASDGHEYQQR